MNYNFFFFIKHKENAHTALSIIQQTKTKTNLLNSRVSTTTSDLPNQKHDTVLAKERKIFPELNLRNHFNTTFSIVGVPSGTSGEVDKEGDEETRGGGGGGKKFCCGWKKEKKKIGDWWWSKILRFLWR